MDILNIGCISISTKNLIIFNATITHLKKLKKELRLKKKFKIF